jgi:hypothetical protein
MTLDMTLGRRILLAALLASPTAAHAQGNVAMLQDLARRATIYLFPLYEMYRTRWQATVDDTNPHRQKLNRFSHVPVLANDRSRQVTTPNSDTLYSFAWLDLSVEPLFLTVPPVGDLYYSYAFMDLFTNNFAYVSHRLHGGQPPPHMIVGPNWKGDAPSEVKLVRAPTNSVWLLGRILVDEPEELDRVRILQARVLLETPDMRNERRILEARELMRQRTVAPPEPVADWPAPNRADPFDLFEVGMRAMGESPVPERDRAFLEQLAPLRLRPGRKFDLRAFSKTEQRAILDGIEQGRTEIRRAGHRYGKSVDGWTYAEPNLGNFGEDYLYRAFVALTGLAALEPVEAIYITGALDSDGQPLDGTHRYELTFPTGGLPPAGAFWSLAMYELTPEGRAFFVKNPIERFSIGDRTRGLVTAADGTLTLYLQHDQPEGERAANWLPAPAGRMRLVLRAYEPGQALVEGRYRVPAVRRID